MWKKKQSGTNYRFGTTWKGGYVGGQTIYFLLKNLPENGVYFAKKRTPFTIFKNYIFQNEPWC